jgi:selenium-binding protein 1
LVLTLAVALLAAFVVPAAASDQTAWGYEHGIVITVDGEDYYFEGAPDGPGGAYDIPGHDWLEVWEGRQLLGRHFNTGPAGAAQWWSSDAPDGALLFNVHAIVDTWSPLKAQWYARAGYVHYHELRKVSDGTLHPTKVVWLLHYAQGTFTLDGGPATGKDIPITPGIARNFLPNWDTPYSG